MGKDFIRNNVAIFLSDLTGTEMDLKDCLTFPKYEQFPPTYVLRYHGINPVVSLLLKIPLFDSCKGNCCQSRVCFFG